MKWDSCVKYVVAEILLLIAWGSLVSVAVVFAGSYIWLPPLISVFFFFFQCFWYSWVNAYNVREIMHSNKLNCEICNVTREGSDQEWFTGSKGCGHSYHRDCYINLVHMTPNLKDIDCPICIDGNKVSNELQELESTLTINGESSTDHVSKSRSAVLGQRLL